MSIWNELGFSDNPYSPRPIRGDESGVRLLVGRDVELKRLMRFLRSSDTHPTLEGPNGVGKTSLVAVAGYLAMREFVEGKAQQALIPIADPFQLSASDSARSFKRQVLLRVAQAFIENHELLKTRGFNVPDIGSINRWLNAPVVSGMGGGFSVQGFGGINASQSNAINTSAGFNEDGFIAIVVDWLRQCFPSPSAGAFICVIDNLELLETSKAARAQLEALRDEVLGIPGLRWVLCGARGITRSVASSPRLQGVIAEPILIDPISDGHISELITARLNEYKVDHGALEPVDAKGFSHLYYVGNRNLRNAMKYAENFTIWVVENGVDGLSQDDLFGLIEAWMAELADQYESDTTGVGQRAWQVFDGLVASGGVTSPSQYEEYGFESNQAMRPHLKALEEANLIESSIDETDNRRKTIGITSRGWIVNYKRSGFKFLAGMQ